MLVSKIHSELSTFSTCSWKGLNSGIALSIDIPVPPMTARLDFEAAVQWTTKEAETISISATVLLSNIVVKAMVWLFPSS